MTLVALAGCGGEAPEGVETCVVTQTTASAQIVDAGGGFVLRGRLTDGGGWFALYRELAFPISVGTLNGPDDNGEAACWAFLRDEGPLRAAIEVWIPVDGLTEACLAAPMSADCAPAEADPRGTSSVDVEFGDVVFTEVVLE